MWFVYDSASRMCVEKRKEEHPWEQSTESILLAASAKGREFNSETKLPVPVLKGKNVAKI